LSRKHDSIHLTASGVGGLVVAATLVVLILSACGGPATTVAPTEVPPPPTDVPTEQPTEVPPTMTPELTVRTAPLPGTLDPIREVVLTRASDGEMVAATLYQLMSIPVADGESVVFHFEDALGATNIACSGHALLRLGEDGTTYEVAGIAAACGQIDVDTPITVYPSKGVDQAGQEVVVIYGEVYDEAVVAIRVFYTGGQANAVISSGGYQAMLPVDASGVNVVAYDVGGSVLYESAP
jgi:hypothetical protein